MHDSALIWQEKQASGRQKRSSGTSARYPSAFVFVSLFFINIVSNGIASDVLLLLCNHASQAQHGMVDSRTELIMTEQDFAKKNIRFQHQRGFLAYLDSAGVLFDGGVAGNGIARHSKARETTDVLISLNPRILRTVTDK